MKELPSENDASDTVDDAELVAYLDGELTEDESRRVEDRLAESGDKRKRAESLKKTFELLDYLPKSEPSSTFASRTLTQLQSTVAAPPTDRRVPRTVRWIGGAIAAFLLAFLLHVTVEPGGRSEVTLDDLPLIEQLPLLAGVDDLEMVRKLDELQFLDEELVGSNATPHRALPRTAEETALLVAEFRRRSPQRQQQLRALHRQLGELPDGERDALRLTLERYAAWLDRLPDATRQRILEAPADKRIDAVADVLAIQRQERLPEAKKQALRALSSTEKAEFLRDYFAAQQTDREEWLLAQRQWNELKAQGDGPPWPFRDAKLKAGIDRYLKVALGVDPAHWPPLLDKKAELPAECRLSREELFELRKRRADAETGKSWLTYGQFLLRLSRDHPMLPKPRSGDAVVRPEQLPKSFKLKESPLMLRRVGKWPDFALDVEARHPRVEALGPAKPEEFADPIRDFAKQELLPKLTADERKKLDGLLGRWPDYPQELLRLADEKNLSVPDATLPGEPAEWKRLYLLPSRRTK